MDDVFVSDVVIQLGDTQPDNQENSNLPVKHHNRGDVSLQTNNLGYCKLSNSSIAEMVNRQRTSATKKIAIKKLPKVVCNEIKSVKYSKQATFKWLREKKHHVDHYTCQIFLSNSDTVGGLTALHLACLHNRADIITMLLEAKADPGSTDDLGRNALHCLCACKSKESILKSFKALQPSARLDLINQREYRYGRTPLMEACLTGGFSILDNIFSSYKPDLTLTDCEGMTLLHYLCASTAEISEDLFHAILSKSNIEARDSRGRTPLLVACEQNKPEFASRLLSAGSDVYVQDRDDRTALHYLSASQSDIIEELIDTLSRKVTERARLSSYIDSEQSLSMIDNFGTPTSMAIKFINRKDSCGRTALQIALNSHNAENAKILIKRGAVIKIKLDDGRQPLQFACDSEKPHVCLAILLIENGANVAIRVENNTLPLLHFACRENFVDLVESLLKHGADIREKDNRGKKPFYYAQSYGVHRLLTKGGGIDNRDRDPCLLDKCCSNGYSDRAIYLIESARHDLVKPKHLRVALRFNYHGIVLALIKHQHWYKFLRSTFDDDKNTVFRELIRKMPEIAEVVLDKCIVSNPMYKDPGDTKFTVIMNYEFLEDIRKPEMRFDSDDEIYFKKCKKVENSACNRGHDCSFEELDKVPQKKFSTMWGPSSFSRINHPLSIMAECGRENLLHHPVVSSLIHYKWSTFGAFGYGLNFLTLNLFVYFLSIWIAIAPSPLLPECSHNQNDSVINVTGDNESVIPVSRSETGDCCSGFTNLQFIFSAIVISLAVGRLIFESFRVISKFNYYDALFWFMKLALYSLSILFVVPITGSTHCVTYWQWTLGVLALFLGWANLVHYAAGCPFTGIYVLMLFKMFYTFIKVALVAAILVIAFGLAFFMIFFEPGFTNSPFSTPSRSIFKMITMATGEFEFDEIFRQSAKKQNMDLTPLSFPVLSYLLWILFIVVMPILLTNMLVGLAVGDIESIKNKAATKKITLQIEHCLTVEEFLRHRPLNWILSIAWRKIYPNSPISSIPAENLSQKHPRVQKLKKRWEQLKFALWGGFKYSKTLKTHRLYHDDSREELWSRMQHIQTQNSELISEVKQSQDKLKRVLEILSEGSKTSGKSVLSPPTLLSKQLSARSSATIPPTSQRRNFSLTFSTSPLAIENSLSSSPEQQTTASPFAVCTRSKVTESNF